MGESKSPALPLGYAPTAEAGRAEPADRFGSVGLQRDLGDFNHFPAMFTVRTGQFCTATKSAIWVLSQCTKLRALRPSGRFFGQAT